MDLSRVLCLFVVTLSLYGTDAVIDWIAVGAASAAAAAVSSGGSMLQTGLGAGYPVVCTIEIENWTKYPLLYPASHINSGQLASSPVPVLPAKREKFVANKNRDTETGTAGTASWLISNGGRKRAVVMWSCPYGFDFHSNWLGVGLTEIDHSFHNDWFDQMYNRASGNGLNFVRGEYYYYTNTISIKDRRFEVTGTMGTSHKTRARLIVRPLEEEDLAPEIKQQAHFRKR